MIPPSSSRVREEMALGGAVVSIFRSHSRGSGKSKSGNRITGVGRVGWKKVEGFFFSPPLAEDTFDGKAFLLLPRRNSLQQIFLGKPRTRRRRREEVPTKPFSQSTLFESAIALSNELTIRYTFHVLLSYIEKKGKLDGTKYV